MRQNLKAQYSVALGIDGSADKQAGVVHLIALTTSGKAWHMGTFRAGSESESAKYYFKLIKDGRSWLGKWGIRTNCSMSDACNTMLSFGSMVIAKLCIGAPKCVCHGAHNVMKAVFAGGDGFEEEAATFKKMDILSNAFSRGKRRDFLHEVMTKKEIRLKMERFHPRLDIESEEYKKKVAEYNDSYNKRHGHLYANKFGIGPESLPMDFCCYFCAFSISFCAFSERANGRER